MKWLRVVVVAAVVAVGSARQAESACLAPTPVPGNMAGILQQAIDACGQGKFMLGAGSYTINGTVNVPPSVTVEGEDYATEVLGAANTPIWMLTGSFSKVSHLRMGMIAPQQGGIGVSFRYADWNNAATDLIFGHYFTIGLDVAPERGSKGVYTIDNIRWNGVLGSNTAIRVGNGVNPVTDVRLTRLSGTANSPADMAVWVDVNAGADTVTMDGLTFIKGGVGIRAGAGTTAIAAVTGLSIAHVHALESMTGYGLLLLSANNVRLDDLSLAQNGGGLGVGFGVRALSLVGAVIHNNQGDGVTLWPGSVGVQILDSTIADNNLSSGTWGFGVSIGTGVSHFAIRGNRINNGLLWGNGKQRYCIFLAPGPSDHYVITDNACFGHTAGGGGNTVYDGGTGLNKNVSQNIQ